VLRWLFRIFAGLSLVLCLVSIFLWFRSYWFSDSAHWWSRRVDALTLVVKGFALGSGVGGLYVGWEYDRIPYITQALIDPNFKVDGKVHWEPATRGYPVYAAGKWGSRSLSLGLGYGWDEAGLTYSRKEFVFPWPVPVFLLALLPSMWLRFHLRLRRRQQRISANLCPNCGYDLRATPSACPECGIKVLKESARPCTPIVHLPATCPPASGRADRAPEGQRVPSRASPFTSCLPLAPFSSPQLKNPSSKPPQEAYLNGFRRGCRGRYSLPCICVLKRKPSDTL
jgi:hypothetical protein